MLYKHDSVWSPYNIRLNTSGDREMDMVYFGAFAFRPNVNAVALDATGDWLYYSAVRSASVFVYRERLLVVWIELL